MLLSKPVKIDIPLSTCYHIVLKSQKISSLILEKKVYTLGALVSVSFYHAFRILIKMKISSWLTIPSGHSNFISFGLSMSKFNSVNPYGLPKLTLLLVLSLHQARNVSAYKLTYHINGVSSKWLFSFTISEYHYFCRIHW